jgi:hypothetical protein
MFRRGIFPEIPSLSTFSPVEEAPLKRMWNFLEKFVWKLNPKERTSFTQIVQFLEFSQIPNEPEKPVEIPEETTVYAPVQPQDQFAGK